MDYRSQGYPQHDVVGTSYYNAAPVFLRQPVRPFLASYYNNSFFILFALAQLSSIHAFYSPGTRQEP
jgi:hypothetical protein